MTQTVICLGAHVFDVHLRPVEAIPDGQGVALVEQIRFSPAGAAGGTSLTLRRNGVQTSSVLPIRPDGSRPAFHVPGANITYGPLVTPARWRGSGPRSPMWTTSCPTASRAVTT